jgi:hypothetical protein
LSLIVMLPRLASPQFGLLDDGATLASSREIVGGDWSPGDEAVKGRFRPAYWLYHAGIFALAGESPFAFFAGNTLVLAASTAGLIAFILRISGKPFQAWATGALYVLAGPVIETFYTISKAEHLQVLWIVLSLLAILPFRRSISKGRSALFFLLASLGLGLACISKETSLVMVPVSLGWLALGFLRRDPLTRKGTLKARGAYFLACLLTAGLYFVWRSFFLSGGLTAGEGYASQYQFTLDRILESSIRWSGWLLRDYFFLLPLALAWGIVLFRKRARPDLLYLDLILWTAAWIALFLPWQFTVEYYMLQAAAGFSAIAALMLQDLLDIGGLPGRAWQAATYACLVLSGFLWILTLFNNSTNARVQLAVDAANSELLAYLSESSPEEGMVLVNLPDQNQYIREIGLLLAHLHDRPDIRVEAFDPETLGAGQPPGAVIVTPFVDNQPLLAVRLGVYEEGADAWNRELKEALGPDSQPVERIDRQFRLASLDLPRLFCPIVKQLDFCRGASPLYDRRLFRYGWEVYSPR